MEKHENLFLCLKFLYNWEAGCWDTLTTLIISVLMTCVKICLQAMHQTYMKRRDIEVVSIFWRNECTRVIRLHSDGTWNWNICLWSRGCATKLSRRKFQGFSSTWECRYWCHYCICLWFNHCVSLWSLLCRKYGLTTGRRNWKWGGISSKIGE